MKNNNLIITYQRSIFWYLARILLGVSVLVLVFFLGRYHGAQDRQQLSEELKVSSKALEATSESLKILEKEHVALEGLSKVDKESQNEMNQVIAGLESHINTLERELSFYRSIMAPELDTIGLQISNLSMHALEVPGHYQFQLALIQAKKHHVFLKGRFEMTILGSLDGKDVEYTLLELSDMTEKKLKFQFKYFQHFKGQLTLPEGFKPKTVKVMAVTQERKPQKVEKVFPWSA